jgi:glutathione reductase (NADPH)
MRTDKFDVVVLGGGNAGIAVTGPTRAAGMSVALIENRDLGGTCPNRGCTPKKVLVAASHALHEIERATSHCISAQKPVLDWPGLIAREKRMIEGIPERLEHTLLRRGVEVIRGEAKFVAPDAITVGDRLLEAEHVVIATGSRARPLEIPGAELLKTSDDLLSETELPDSVVFIGGGVISLEFGHVYARAGVKVTVLEVLPQLLPALDGDAVALLRQECDRIGIQINTGIRIERIEAAKGKVRVVFANADGQKSVDAAWAVNGAGRLANVDQLDLRVADVDHVGPNRT